MEKKKKKKKKEEEGEEEEDANLGRGLTARFRRGRRWLHRRVGGSHGRLYVGLVQGRLGLDLS